MDPLAEPQQIPWGVQKVFKDSVSGHSNMLGKGEYPESDITICIVDTGYDETHPDLLSRGYVLARPSCRGDYSGKGQRGGSDGDIPWRGSLRRERLFSP